MKVFQFRGEQVTMYMAKYVNGSLSLQIKDLMGFPVVRVSSFSPEITLKENEIAINFAQFENDVLRFLLDKNIFNKESARLEDCGNEIKLVANLNPQTAWRGWRELSEETLDSAILGIAV